VDATDVGRGILAIKRREMASINGRRATGEDQAVYLPVPIAIIAGAVLGRGGRRDRRQPG
jgi:hypothetical protein